MALMVTQTILGRVLRIGWNNKTASAQLFQHEGEIVLLTAAHAVKGIVAGDNLLVRHQSNWSPRRAKAVFFDDEGNDVCGVAVDAQGSVGMEINMLNAQILQGAEVVFAGYPLGLEMSDVPERDGWPIPYIKAGIFSGWMTHEGAQYLLFDAMNNVGFSGGPVIYRHHESGKLEIGGLVSNYRFDAPLPVLEKEGKELKETGTHFVRPNSGFMAAVPARHMKRVLEKVVETAKAA